MWGVVKSREGETLLEALVTVIGRKDYSTTDVEGRYRLELPPGTYQLRVQYELHRPARVKNVRVVAGRVSRVDVILDPDVTAVEEVTAVEAEVERASAATQLFLRKNAAQASDSVGAQDIAKTPDRNAADAVKRVVGTTVVDGRYIFIRGLGDRYTNTMLNGSPLPSPEPDRQAVPLDMFPALVLSDLTVSKTFTPDMPGDFAGGSLNIHTRDLPNKFLFQTHARPRRQQRIDVRQAPLLPGRQPRLARHRRRRAKAAPAGAAEPRDPAEPRRHAQHEPHRRRPRREHADGDRSHVQPAERQPERRHRRLVQAREGARVRLHGRVHVHAEVPEARATRSSAPTASTRTGPASSCS